MPSAVAMNSHESLNEPDDLDRYFNYDDAVEDFLKDLPIDKDKENQNKPEPMKDIDEEVVVKKQRKSVPKLDDNRLLSQEGIPRLRKITKSRLKFRGKGHEFSDISRLLNTYQLWLDDLYPRAKFRDALGMVEKVGHSKRMQVMRKSWLDATKPYQKDAEPAEEETVEMSGAIPGNETTGIGENGSQEAETAETQIPADSARNDAPEPDELDDLLAEEAHTVQSPKAVTKATMRGPFEEDDDVEEDDLDALLAEDSLSKITSTPYTGTSVEGAHSTQNDFADEEEVMAGMDIW